MRIGLNLMYLVPGEVGGTETYARELIAELAGQHPDDEFFVYCGREAAAVFPDERWPSNVEVRRLNVTCRNKPLRVAAELLMLPRHARRDGVELMHSLGVTTPLWGCGTRVVSIHDLIFHHFPKTFPKAARIGLELLVPRGARRAARVITLSEFSKQDLVETFGIESGKIDVVPLGTGISRAVNATAIETLRSAFEIGEGAFALCVASGHEHKNLPRLLEALAKCDPQLGLVIVGHAGLEHADLVGHAAELGLEDRVTFTGWVDDADLEGFYAAASLFVYPTLREGFGIPVLEAMSRGVAVACSADSSLPEVAGDAAVLFDPRSASAIAGAIDQLATDAELRAEKIAAGIERAKTFSWSRTARETWQSYTRALAQN